MKIAYIITKSNWGGAQKYVYDCATAIRSTYPETDITVLLGGDGELRHKLDEAGIKTISIPHLERDVNILSELKVFWFIYKWIFREQPDVVHLNSSKIGGLGTLAARIAGIKKIIFTAHGWAFNENRSALSKAVIHFLYWITIVLSHITICVSETMKKQVANYLFVQTKIAVIHNGIKTPNFVSREDARKFILEKIDEKGRVGLQDRPWIVNIAELHPVKGQRYLVDACDIMKGNTERNTPEHAQKMPAIFVIGTGELEQEFKTTIKNLGIENDIFFIGHIPQAATYLKAFDLFVMPSLSEGLGYVVIEAGFAQLPVIVTNVGGLPEIIEDEKTGLLIPSKHSFELTKAIEYMLSHKNEAKSMAKELNTKVMEKFSLEQMIKRTWDEYKY